LLNLIEEVVKRVGDHGPKARLIGGFQVEGLDSGFENGDELLDPPVGVEKTVADVTDLGKVGAEFAPGGETLDGLDRKDDCDAEEEDAGDEPKVEEGTRSWTRRRNSFGEH